jgi:hypothetical protein
MTMHSAYQALAQAVIAEQLLRFSGEELIEQRDEARDWAVNLLALVIGEIGDERWERIRRTPPLSSIPAWLLERLPTTE